MKRSLLVPFVALLAACSGAPAPQPVTPHPPAPTPVAPPAAAAKDPLATPPAAGVTPEARFPAITRRTLPSGLELAVISRRSLPLVELRLVFRSGTASDGSKPGVAGVAGELVKVGGAGPWATEALLERAESLGTDLNVGTDRDSTRISLGVTSTDVDAALDILSAMAMKPRFDATQFGKLRTREFEAVRAAAKGDAGFAASMILYRELFEVPTAIHPYSRYAALPEELQKLTLADCKAWHKEHMTPKNAVLVAVGDIDLDRLARAAERAFAGWKGEKPSEPRFIDPMPDDEPHLYLVDRPGSPQAEVRVARLGPTRQTPDWPSLALLNQVLGGGVSGRLFMDVREKRSLAYRTGSGLGEPAHGPVPIVLSAGTQTDKAPLAVKALFDQLAQLTSSPPTTAEVDRASHVLSDSFLFGTETASALAELTTKLSVLSLPDSYYDDYRKAVRTLDSATALSKAGLFFKNQHPVMVVAGDADKLAQRLTHFAKVIIVDPQKSFAPGKMLPFNPAQTIE